MRYAFNRINRYGTVGSVKPAMTPFSPSANPLTPTASFGLGTAASCASKSEWKNKLKAEAQRRFPQLNVTLKTADALLIIEWVRAARGQSGDVSPHSKVTLLT